MGRIVVDRIDKQNDLARLEICENIITVDLDILPMNIKEGDILKLVLDKDDTDSRKRRIEALESKLFK